ncbi:hypothetical protein [Nocardioides panaciterrulae]|uniref:Uncharacterized protein n=1 Tax=Nocardioides panaciterrulae TaxID=661492 RepID=A0A7Y9E3B7_9ACTN|nr:hypothetical protein [Nocardioides panaciterrulae]NYD40334.1 hypothetical protein [Nocardioides panaciterrulae]
MLISGRQAVEVLAGAGVTRRQARAALAARLAGEPVVTRGARLYREEAVIELASRPPLSESDVDHACPGPLFVARRLLDAGAGREEQLAALAPGWDLGVRGTNNLLQAFLYVQGSIPLVATVCGFVVLGAQIQRLRGEVGGRTYRMELGDAGEWFAAFRGRRLLCGPGRDFVFRGW